MRVRRAVLCVLLGGALTCAAQEPSLGDVARQQKAVSRPAAKRVIDNENLPHASAAEARNGAVVMPKPAESKAEEKPSETKATPASTLATPADAQKRLDDLKATAEAQQRAINKFDEELKDEAVSAERRQVFEAGLSTAKQALEQVMKEIAGVEHSVKPAEQGQPEDAKPQAEDAKSQSESKPDEAVAPPPNNNSEKASDSKAPEKSAANKDGN
jgi:hypothetical protein